MVFLTLRLLMRKRKMVPYPERQWKRLQQWRILWHIRSRRRNCYRLGKNAVKHSLRATTVFRKQRRDSLLAMYAYRIAAGCSQHGVQYSLFLSGLRQSKVALNNIMLAQLAAYEPRSFQSMCEFVKKKHQENAQQGLASVVQPPPSGVITREMIQSAGRQKS